MSAVMQNAPSEPRVYGPLDQYYVKLSRKHPGFAGLYFDADGRMVIRTKSGSIPPGLARLGHPAVEKVAAEASLSFLDLARWYGPFVDAVATTHWYTTDINERVNRLKARVADVGSTESALRDAGVPPEVYFLERGRPGRSVKSIRSEFRPVPGAVEIVPCASDGSDCNTCTLGFNLDHWSYGRSFVTASHCTFQIGAVDGTNFNQPSSGTRIGSEVYDASLFQDPECPTTYCRYSDAALVRYETNVDYEHSRIVHTHETEGSLETESSGARYTIVDEVIEGMADGTPVLQIGRTDGWSDGNINETCANVQSGTRSDVTFLCQYKSSSGAKGGDSGGPVFIQEMGVDNVKLAGIMWREHEDWQFESDTWFSSIVGIRAELDGNEGLFCDGLLTTEGGACGTSGTAGSGEEGEDCEPFAVQECI